MTEPKFVPKNGQVDYTNIRYCPVVNTVVTRDGKVLLVQRSNELRLYPGCWNGISGFLDDNLSIEKKVKEELLEELGIEEKDIAALKRGKVLLQEAPQYKKTWLIVPVLATVKTDAYTLDSEAQAAKWLEPNEALKLQLLPGFDEVFRQFF